MAALENHPVARPVTALTAVAVLVAGYTSGAVLRWNPPPHAGPAQRAFAELPGDVTLFAVAAAAAVSFATRALAASGRLRAAWLLYAASALAVAHPVAGLLLAAPLFVPWLGGGRAAAPWIRELIDASGDRARRPRAGVPRPRGGRGVREPAAASLRYAAAALCLAAVLAGDLTAGHRVDPALLSAGAAVLVALVLQQTFLLSDACALARELSVREEHFRSLVQGSTDVIMVADPRGILGYVSPAVRRVFGYEPETLANTSVYGLIHRDDHTVVTAAIERFLAADEAGVSVECRIRARPAPSAGGKATWRHAECALTRHRSGLVFTCRDVSDRVALQQRLVHNAYHDPLTGLPNRALFADRLEQALAHRRAATEPMAVLFLDLDWFKQVNDACGHETGDALLVEVAARLRGAVRAGDTVARLGGDEFAALVQGGADERAACRLATRLRTALARPYLLAGGRHVIGASIGVAFWRPGVSAADLMREADAAMYEAKAGGKARVVVRRPAPGASARPAGGPG